jgi:hypothetical protein
MFEVPSPTLPPLTYIYIEDVWDDTASSGEPGTSW